MKKGWLAFLVIVAGLLGWGAWSAHSSCQLKQAKVTNVGSTALQPLAEAAVPGFNQQHPRVNVTIQGGGSGTGLSQVQAGAVDLGSSDVYAEQKKGIDATKLEDHIVAVAGIVPIVNPKLKVNNLTTDQLRRIFTGEITNWQTVGGPDEKITIINRADGSGTRLAFEDLILKGQAPKPAQEQDSNGTVKQIVANTPGAISYVALPYVNSTVKTLTLNGVKATAANIQTNRWPLWSYEHVYFRKNASPAARAFVKYLTSPTVQQTLVPKAHYVSVDEMQVHRDAHGKLSPVKGK